MVVRLNKRGGRKRWRRRMGRARFLLWKQYRSSMQQLLEALLSSNLQRHHLRPQPLRSVAQLAGFPRPHSLIRQMNLLPSKINQFKRNLQLAKKRRKKNLTICWSNAHLHALIRVPLLSNCSGIIRKSWSRNLNCKSFIFWSMELGSDNMGKNSSDLSTKEQLTGALSQI